MIIVYYHYEYVYCEGGFKMIIPDNLKIDNPEYLNIICSVGLNAKKILDNPVHNHFTDHSISHSCRMLNYIDKLLDAPQILIDEEKLVLICAVLLHDIGMQATKKIPLSEMPLQNEELEYIREHHHEFSEEIIKNSISLDHSKKYYLGLENVGMYVEDIALVAKHHRKSNISSLSNDTVGDKTIRIKLLAALIRFADCLDIDFRRVHIDRLIIQNIPVESKFYWFSHHYVRALIIENRAIKVCFQFPKEYQNETTLISTISEYILKEINKHMEQVYFILDEYGIRLRKDVDKESNYYDTYVSILPDDLREYISGINVSKKLVETERENGKSFENCVQPTYSSSHPILNGKCANGKDYVCLEQELKAYSAALEIQNRLFEAKQSITDSHYDKAIDIINETILNIKKHCMDIDDYNDVLAECYRLKCNAYRALGGNGNLLFAVLCNKAQDAL